MKKYLLLFRNTTNGQEYAATPEQMIQDMELWKNWIGEIAVNGDLIMTNPIEFAGKTLTAKNTESKSYIDNNNQIIAGYIILNSKDDQTVEKYAQKCPILKYENASVEIRQIIDFQV